MKDTDIAWAAGIIDGEGCIYIGRQQGGTFGRVNVSHRMYVKVTMCHRPTLEALRAIFGMGSVHHQDKATERRNDSYSWWVGARQAEQLLLWVRPYLVTKAIEADIALEFMALPSGLTGGAHGNSLLPAELIERRESLYWRLREAKPVNRFRTMRRTS